MTGILNVLAGDNAAAGGGSLTYATWNPSDKAPDVVLSNGNLTIDSAVNGAFNSVRATQGKSSGKWYWELTLGNGTTSVLSGIANGATSASSMTTFVGNFAKSFGVYNNTGFVNGVTADNTPNLGLSNGDIVSIAFDAGAGKAWVAKNGTWFNSDPTGADCFSGMNVNGPWYPAVSTNNTGVGVLTANFGATAFSFTVPSGFNAGVYI